MRYQTVAQNSVAIQTTDDTLTSGGVGTFGDLFSAEEGFEFTEERSSESREG